MRLTSIFLLTAMIAACGDKDDTGTVDTAAIDADGDGYAEWADCDDNDADISPDAIEVCDGIDNDCDGRIDAADPSIQGATAWYVDLDGDDFGDTDTYDLFCESPTDRILDDTDCDDNDPQTFPGATEYCDDVDNDCNGLIDDIAADADTWYRDVDGDLFGDPESPLISCEPPRGYVINDEDCNDQDASWQPGASWYPDADGDGYGDPTAPVVQCEPPEGYVYNDNDCADDDAEQGPLTDWYRDLDGDGYGDSTITRQQCTQPASDWSRFGDDCNPSDPTTFPGATDVCFDNIDNDCDGVTDPDCGIQHCGPITTAEVWDASTPHTITCNVSVYGSSNTVLTIEDGAVVRFQPGTGLLVGTSAPGRLIIDGHTTGVTLTSDRASPTPGNWVGVQIGINDSGTIIDGLTLSYGGSQGAGLQMNGGTIPITNSDFSYNAGHGIDVVVGTVEISDSTFTHNTQDGVRLSANADFTTTNGPTFSGNTMSDNGRYPLAIGAGSLDQVAADNTFGTNASQYIQVRPDIVNRGGTWRDLGVDYLVSGTFYVQGTNSPEVVIEDGTSFYMAANTDVVVGYGNPGRLIVNGSTNGVLFTSSRTSPAPGDWNGITFQSSSSGSELNGTTVEYAGANTFGNVYMFTSSVGIHDSVIQHSSTDGVYVSISSTASISGSTISNNASEGVYLHPSARLAVASQPTFTNNTLSSNGGSAMVVPADYLGMLDSNTTITGNGEDAVVVAADIVTADATWQNLLVPYRVTGDVYINAGSEPVVTIAPGTTLSFGPGADLFVGHSGRGGLVAQGTPASRITFTSSQASPSAGDWGGITVGSGCLASDLAFQYVDVHYGGRNGFGNLYFNLCGGGAVSDANVTNSYSYGVYDYFSGTSFTNVTYSSNALGGYQEVN